jgi:glycosyltransferase involved in cell wall biosynthesis
VTFAGWVAADQVADEIRASRAVIMPSFAEGLPVVIMEALALGRPVVSSSVAAVPELVRAHESGWLVTPGSMEDLAEAIRTVLTTSVEELTAMGRRGAVRVRAEHSIDTQIGKMISLLCAG